MDSLQLRDIRAHLKETGNEELIEIIIRLVKYKKENKELITFLLEYSDSEDLYIKILQDEIKESFNQLNLRNFYIVKKGVRKILRIAKRYIRYSQSKTVEIEVLMYFCKCIKTLPEHYFWNNSMIAILHKQYDLIEKRISMLHEDLAFDYTAELKEIKEF